MHNILINAECEVYFISFIIKINFLHSFHSKSLYHKINFSALIAFNRENYGMKVKFISFLFTACFNVILYQMFARIKVENK
jgi:hypothetical protein